MKCCPVISRRDLLGGSAAVAATALVPRTAAAQRGPILTRPIPSTGEALPLVGLGSWITFNVGDDAAARDACAEVMRAFFAAGGRMIDSSPMYGSSQEVIGHGLAQARRPPALFSADKVWISPGEPRARADRRVAPLLGRAALRSPAGAQPARLGRASARRCSP